MDKVLRPEHLETDPNRGKAGHISDKPFIGSSVYNRFKQYLKDAGLDGGETPHSLHAGCSITLKLLGVSKSDIAKHIGWHSTGMVDHYNDLEQIAKPVTQLKFCHLPLHPKLLPPLLRMPFPLTRM